MVSYQDIRYSLRTLTGSPGLAIVTVLTLALGIGANTAIFTLVNALVLRKLAVPNPKELVQIAAITRNGGTAPLSFAMLRELEERQRVFAGVFGASGSITFNVEVNGYSLQIHESTANPPIGDLPCGSFRNRFDARLGGLG